MRMSEKTENNVSELEQLYRKYFKVRPNIDSEYHKIYDIFAEHLDETAVVRVVDNATEQAVINATMDVNAFCKSDKTREQLLLDNICSVLDNLSSLSDEKLKKEILLRYRRYYQTQIQTQGGINRFTFFPKLGACVARAAIANGLGTSFDYSFLAVYEGTKKYFNDFIEQSRKDIKSEMNSDVPSYTEIKSICAQVIGVANMHKLPTETLIKEFNAKDIIGEHIKKVKKDIELNMVVLKSKAAAYDKVVIENQHLKAKVESLKTALKEIGRSSDTVKASLLSRNVIKHKLLVRKKLKENTL